MKKNNVLITGSSGFTGHYLVRELEKQNYETFGLNNSSAPSQNDFQVDLLDLSSLVHAVNIIKPNYVIHLGAISNVAHSKLDDFYDVNIKGTLNLLNALSSLKITPDRIILASSANIYGNQASGLLDENTCPNPVNHYAVSKWSMELMARIWRDRLSITITRPFNYTGVGQSNNFVIPKIVAHYKKKSDKITLGNLNVFRDFSDVRFVAEAYVKIMDNNQLVGDVVNICSGKLYSLNDILAICEDISQHKVEVEVGADFIRKNEVINLGGDPSKLTSNLQYLSQFSMRQTLEWMLTDGG